jgi:S1-C subfamily serine protease
MFMNADGTIYGRYGTRNQKPDHADSQISIEGLRKSMEAVIHLHRNYPANREALLAKKGAAPPYPSAEKYPTLQKYTPRINYQNQVAKSCIHCHQIHNAERQMLRDAGKPIPDEVLYLYPMPQVVGIELDPKNKARVLSVKRGSAAEKAELRAGDELISANGQPLVSIADFQWVLHKTPGKGGQIPLDVLRSGKRGKLNLSLADGWRKQTNFEWRVSTWDLRRMALGGMILEADPRSAVGLSVKGAGKYGNHAVARKAGVRPGDTLIEIHGIKSKATEGEVIAHILDTTRKGQPIQLKVRRGSREINISFRTQ